MLCCFAAYCWRPAPGEELARLTVDIDRPLHQISPLLYGLFFEEINRAGDGGIYAEMVQNRSFEDADQPAAWSLGHRRRRRGPNGAGYAAAR